MNSKKVAFVTGSTDGIGLFTSTKLSQMGYHVIIHGRSKERVDKAIQTIKQTNPTADLNSIVCDVSSIQSTIKMCETILKEYDHMNILINNAGVFLLDKEVSVDGYEMTFAVNVIAPYVITNKLLPLIQATPQSRIIEVGSISQPRHMDLTKIHHEKYDCHRAYNYSKLAVIAMTFELSKRYPDIWINTLDPGTVNTKMLIISWGRCGIEIEDADNELWLATSDKVKDIKGKYFVDKRQERAGEQAYDLDFRKQLFNLLESFTKLSYSKVE